MVARQVFARADLPTRGASIPTPSSAVREDIAIRDRRVADRVQKFPESVIREMTRIAALHGAVNLAQGYPDFEPPRELTEAAKRALDGGYNQYSITWGARELRDAIARRAKAFNGIDAVTDEIYEHIVFDGARHVSLATIGDMADRTITINGLSKTYSATGWRIGWAIAPKTLANAMRRTHDFLTVGAPHPLQIAAVAALGLPESYYAELARSDQAKRDVLVQGLRDAGPDCQAPGGAYYVMADFERFPFDDDWAFAMYLVERLRVAVVPGSSFYGDPVDGRRYVRFMFSKREETLRDAISRLADLRDVP